MFREPARDIWWSFLTLVFICATGALSYELTVAPSGDEFIKAIGQSGVFTCAVAGAGSPNDRVVITWKDSLGRAVGETIGIKNYVEKESPTSSKLYVTGITNEDAGRYSCELSVNGAKLREKFFKLTIFKDITFDNAPSIQNPELHTNAIIQCRVSAEPKPEVSWRFKNQKIEPNARYSMDVNGLTIKNITQSDNGMYTCRAEVKSEGRYDERRLNVVVHIRPKITKKLEEVTGKQGTNLMISCHAVGLPSPKYEFLKNKNKLIATDQGRIVIDGDLGRVFFKPLRKEDEGDYTCVAINDVGETKSTASIFVLVAPEITELKNLTKMENETAVLDCKSLGDPAPTMTFRKVGHQADYNASNEGGRIHLRTTTGRLQLEIKKLNPSDAGNYTCSSHNSAGNHTRTGFLTVNYKPRFPQDHVRKVYIWAGKTHNITCDVQAHPLPQIDWLRHGRVLENNDTYQIFKMKTHSNLQVRVKEADQSWIYGIYTCKAKNALGEKQIDINMTKATVPNAPLVRVKERSTNMIILEAEPPVITGGRDIIGYRVEYGRRLIDFGIGFTGSRAEPGSSNAVASQSNQNRTTELVIENLKASTTYTFYVRAKNEVGVGHLTEQMAHTDSYKAPYPIRIVSHKLGREPYEYRLIWYSPKTGGKPIQRYNIKYRQRDAKDWRDISFNDDPNNPVVEHRIRGLSPKTVYELEISARNEIGVSQSTHFIFHTSTLAKGRSASSLNLGEILNNRIVIGIGLALLAIFILVVDVACFFMRRRGILMCVCVHVCGLKRKKRGDSDDDTDDIQPTTPLPPTSSAPNNKSILKNPDRKAKESDANEVREPLIKATVKTESERCEKKAVNYDGHHNEEKRKLVETTDNGGEHVDTSQKHGERQQAVVRIVQNEQNNTSNSSQDQVKIDSNLPDSDKSDLKEEPIAEPLIKDDVVAETPDEPSSFEARIEEELHNPPENCENDHYDAGCDEEQVVEESKSLQEQMEEPFDIKADDNNEEDRSPELNETSAEAEGELEPEDADDVSTNDFENNSSEIVWRHDKVNPPRVTDDPDQSNQSDSAEDDTQQMQNTEDRQTHEPHDQ